MKLLLSLRTAGAIALGLFLSLTNTYAGSATWATNPTTGDWDTATNWVPNTVPNSPTDIATFSSSTQTTVSSESYFIHLDSLIFSEAAPSYTLNLNISELVLHNGGIINNSGSPQVINVAIPIFYSSSTAGDMVTYNSPGGLIQFYDSSSAGSATFNLPIATNTGSMLFYDVSSAGDATVNASMGSTVWFEDASSGGNATFNLTSGASMILFDTNDAEHMSVNCSGGNEYFASGIEFLEYTSAGDGTYTLNGASAAGELGATIDFYNAATAANATFIINGGLGSGLAGTTVTFRKVSTAADGTFIINGGGPVNTPGGAMYFTEGASAGNANITINGGIDYYAGGGKVIFEGRSSGGSAQVSIFGNGELVIGHHIGHGISIGSLAGQGTVVLGSGRILPGTHTLTVGSNNQSTTYAGVIQGPGGLTKTGTGTLTLKGENTYAGTTTVTAGVLRANSTHLSATGTGDVSVQTGTLGGTGIIAGPVTIGTGSGSGAFLAPSANSQVPSILRCKKTLTFNSDSTYSCTLRANRTFSQSDEVIAKGVTISGAQFDLSAKVWARLAAGTTFTVIDNVDSTPINGTFANLPDGGTIVSGGVTLKASYEGGDGNDLTLTVE